MANVHALPRATARRRRTALNAPLAQVIPFPAASVSADQAIAELEEVLLEVSRGLLMAIHAINEHRAKPQQRRL